MLTSVIISSWVVLLINLPTGVTVNWINLNLDNVVYSSSSIKTVSKIQCVMLASLSPSVTSFSYHRGSRNCYFYTEVPGIHVLPLPSDLVGAKTYMKFGIQETLDTTTEPPTTTTEPPTTTTPYQPTVPPLTGAALCATKSGYTYDGSSNGCFRTIVTLAFINSANQTCIDDGGYLMRLNSPAKRNWLRDNMMTGSVWLGGKKDAAGDWFWGPGDPVNHSDFVDILRLNLPTFDCISYTKSVNMLTLPWSLSYTMDTTTCILTLSIACEIPV